MDLMDKLTILADSAKYDVACTSSGAEQRGGRGLGSTVPAGCCHSFAADGRCISLLKVLLSNACTHDCRYCVNRASNDVPRASFTPEELAELTIQFYRRNYIEGLFLSSGVLRNPDYTMEQMIRVLELLRYQHNFWGYIHAKAIPGASPRLIERLGMIADRLSVNIEMPSEQSLKLLAPAKTKQSILGPMGQIKAQRTENREAIALYRNAPRFAPAGQSTQMIIGATPDTDLQIIRLASGLYSHYDLRRVFYSAYIPVVEDTSRRSTLTKPPRRREHRRYQAGFLMRQYRFDANEILDDEHPHFNPYLDPKCNWALHHMERFPVDVNTADMNALLRVPGIGPKSAERIVAARRTGSLSLAGLKRLGVVMKRAQFFITCSDLTRGLRYGAESVVRSLVDPGALRLGMEQVSMFGGAHPALLPDATVSARDAVEEAVKCLAAGL